MQASVVPYRTALQVNGTVRNANNGAGYQLWDDATQSLTSIFGNASSMAAYKNSGSVTLTDASAMPSLNFNGFYSIGLYNTGSSNMNGKINELVIYSTDQTANRAGIELHINSFYTIY